MKMLGLIGGTSWVSTVEYYRLINEEVNRQLGGSQYAKCLIHSLNFGEIEPLVLRQDWDAFLEIVAKASAHLRAGGAEAIVLCANTPHVIADRLQERIDIPVIHIADATAAEIRKLGLASVALLGTRFTMEMTFFKERLARHGIQTAIPADRDRQFIHDSIFTELGKGILRPATKERYLEIIGGLAQRGAQGVILGCTEIPLLVQQKDCQIPAFDTTAIHASAAVSFALG